MKGKHLINKNKQKIIKHKDYTCLSESEITNLFFVEQATGRTHLKEVWLSHHKKNLTRILNAFMKNLPQHLTNISSLYATYKKAAINRLATMDQDACNPKHYELKHFPEEMTQYLTRKDKEKYQQRLNRMEKINASLEKFATTNLSKGVVIGFVSMRIISKEILKKLKISQSKQHNDWDFARLMSTLIVSHTKKYSQKGSKNLHFFSDKTRENICENNQLLFVNAWSATELGNKMIDSIGKIFDQHGRINQPMLTKLIADWCTKTIMGKKIIIDNTNNVNSEKSSEEKVESTRKLSI